MQNMKIFSGVGYIVGFFEIKDILEICFNSVRMLVSKRPTTSGKQRLQVYPPVITGKMPSGIRHGQMRYLSFHYEAAGARVFFHYLIYLVDISQTLYVHDIAPVANEINPAVSKFIFHPFGMSVKKNLVISEIVSIELC
jgi:hypothetical protein